MVLALGLMVTVRLRLECLCIVSLMKYISNQMRLSDIIEHLTSIKFPFS